MCCTIAQPLNLSCQGALFTRKTSLNHLTYDRQEIYHVIWQTKVMFLQRFSSSFDVWITCFKAWKHGSMFKTLGMVFHFQIPHSNLNAFQQSLANLILRKRLKKKTRSHNALTLSSLQNHLVMFVKDRVYWVQRSLTLLPFGITQCYYKFNTVNLLFGYITLLETS